jgi:NADPH2:quinone reductase
MRAAQVGGFGDVDRIDLVEMPRPHPGSGEVLVRVKACGLNYSDALQRQGLYLGGPRPPFVPGMEAAGIVERTGMAASPIPIGTRVAVLASGGLHAEWAVARAADCIRLPDSMSFAEGAAFPVQYLTAYHALTTVARAAPGESVVIHAAGGGVGTAAVQIARLLGLVVLATASTEEKRARIRELGATRAVGYDQFVEAARELTGGEGPDIIVDSVGGDVFRRSLGVLPPLGRLVVVGATSGASASIDTVRLLFRSHGILGFHLSALLRNPELVRKSVERLLSWVERGDLRMQIGEELGFADIRRAHRLIASRERYGKIVLVWG